MPTASSPAPGRLLGLLLLCSLISFSSCASRRAKQEAEERQENAAAQAQNASSDPRLQALNARLDDLDAKIAAMNDKLNSTRQAVDGFMAAHQPQGAGVPMQASDTVGIAVTAAPLATSSAAGFVDNDAVHLYRKAAVLLKTKRYPEAITAFSAFLSDYPDNPLAGSAQFHVGEAYFRQKQFVKAEAEFQKVLTSYDRSPHVSDALLLMSQAEDAIGKTEAAARHRQLLTSLFASSPAAARVSAARARPEAQGQGQDPQSQPAAAPQEVQQNQPQQHEEDQGIPANPVTPLAKPGLDEPPPTANMNQ